MRRKRLLIPLIILGAFVIYCGGYLYYLKLKLDPIVDDPWAAVVAEPFELTNEGSTVPLNLGYTETRIPASLGATLKWNGTDLVPFLVAESKPFVTFFPPQNSQSPEILELMEMLSDLSGQDVRDYFEYESIILRQMPFTIWDAVRQGREKAIVRAALLTIKSLLCSNATSVRIFEDGQVGMIIYEKPDMTFTTLADRRTGVTQTLIIDKSFTQIDALLSAIVLNYSLPVEAIDSEVYGRQIRALNLPILEE